MAVFVRWRIDGKKDLAHGLPTKYIHFLTFCIRVDLLCSYDVGKWNRAYSKIEFQEKWINKWDMEDSIKDYIVNAYENRKVDGIPSQETAKIEDEVLVELYELIHNNIWFRYYNDIYNKKRIKGENWIDFETEIRYVIQKIDETTDDLSADLSEIFQKLQEQEDVKFNTFIGHFMNRIGKSFLKDFELNIREFRQITFEDLERIIRALEIYLNKFVDEILDITDKDILSGFIGADSTSVTVYCYDKGTEGELIANTIKLISEKRLLEKINNVPSKLDYVIQKKKVVF